MTRSRTFLLIGAMVFFFTPLALLLVGVRAEAFENRKLASPPRMSQGWGIFGQTTKYLVDRLPMRQEAIEINTWKSLNIFKTAPRYGSNGGNSGALPFGVKEKEVKRDEKREAAPATASQVLVGRSGWLYLQGDIDRACSPFLPWDEAVSRWERLGKMLRESGRNVVVVIPPDKSTIYPQHLPKGMKTRECMEDGKKALWNQVESSDEPSLLGLRASVKAEATQADQPLYYLKDSHWNTYGSLVFVREVTNKIGPEKIDDRNIEVGNKVERTGDLSSLLGSPENDNEVPSYLVRPGVKPGPVSLEKLPGGGELSVTQIKNPGQLPTLPGRTLFIHDSYGIGPFGGIQQQAEEFAAGQWYNTKPEDLAVAMAGADHLVLENVEREVTYRALEILTPAFFSSLEKELAANPRPSRSARTSK